MKSLFFCLCLAATTASAYYDPTMRIHFGASNALLRVQTGYFKCPGEPQTLLSEGTSTQSNSMLNNMRMQMEAMVMLNNRGNFSESVFHTAPRFLNLKSEFDGLQKTLISSISFAQGLPCMNTFPLMGQVKGYWSLGAASRMHTANQEVMNPGSDLGGRIGLNIYSPKAAIQAEVFGFSNNLVVNALVHRKIGQHLMLNSGVEYNQPVLGLSVLAGSWRFNTNTRYCHKSMQYGFQMTVNL